MLPDTVTHSIPAIVPRECQFCIHWLADDTGERGECLSSRFRENIRAGTEVIDNPTTPAGFWCAYYEAVHE